MKTSIVVGTVCLSLGFVAAGCAGDAGRDEEGSAEQDRSTQEALLVQYCNTGADCVSGCACEDHQCALSGFGPPPNPIPDCSQPPQRTCAHNADCRSACDCLGGTCQPDGFSPPYGLCILPPQAVMPISGTWVDCARAGSMMG